MTPRSARRAVGISMISAALTLSACGSDQPANSSGLPANGPVVTRDLPGIGTVLADTAGRTLYVTDTDQPGTIKCVEDCVQLWHPVPAPDKVLGTNLGVVARPDGSNQLSYQGRPLYTFTKDSQDKPASGHNAKDSFGGVEFTWHAVIVSASDQPAPTGDPGGGGY